MLPWLHFTAVRHAAMGILHPAMRILPVIIFALVTWAQAARAQSPSAPASLQQWFATPAEKRGVPPGERVLSKAEAAGMVAKLMAACREGGKALGWDKAQPPLPPTLEELQKNPPKEPLRPSALKIGEFTMPYVMLAKGEKPKTGWPLFLCLHGGGGNDQAQGPHAWEVNTREWQAQMALFERVYAPAGIYFIPRMADDRKGRWYLDHNQAAFEQIIRDSILYRDVDPNRVYLMGISEGGYGAIRFAGNRPDRFAATNGMAAAEPLDTSPPENMRNVAMRIDIGEKDTMFDRVGLARRMGERLGELKKDDPGGYDFLVNVQPGRGHGIDYAEGPKWIAQRTRNPLPQRVVWTVRPFDKTVALQRYWLALPEAPQIMPLYLTATLSGNAIAITAETNAADGKGRTPAAGGSILVRLSDAMLDLDQPVTISVNGKAIAPAKAERRLSVMARTMAERCDPHYTLPAEITVPLAP